jgi:hypothetical protein
VEGDLNLSDMRRLYDRQARAPYPAKKPAKNVVNKIRLPSIVRRPHSSYSYLQSEVVTTS